MQTSDSCLLRARHGSRRIASIGFSLLEMLVVLMLISVMTALVAPRLQGTVEAIASSGERAEVARQLERLPLLVRQQGHSIQVAVGEDVSVPSLELPVGWKVQPLTILSVAGNGICNAASLKVEGRGVAEKWSIAAPDCKVSDGD